MAFFILKLFNAGRLNRFVHVRGWSIKRFCLKFRLSRWTSPISGHRWIKIWRKVPVHLIPYPPCRLLKMKHIPNWKTWASPANCCDRPRWEIIPIRPICPIVIASMEPIGSFSIVYRSNRILSNVRISQRKWSTTISRHPGVVRCRFTASQPDAPVRSASPSVCPTVEERPSPNEI